MIREILRHRLRRYFQRHQHAVHDGTSTSTRARGLLHVVGDRKAASTCGVDYLEQFVAHVDGLTATPEVKTWTSPARSATNIAPSRIPGASLSGNASSIGPCWLPI